MPLNIDMLAQSRTELDGVWYVARPLLGSFKHRLEDAWLVLTGKADAITYGPYKSIADMPKGNVSLDPYPTYGTDKEK